MPIDPDDYLKPPPIEGLEAARRASIRRSVLMAFFMVCAALGGLIVAGAGLFGAYKATLPPHILAPASAYLVIFPLCSLWLVHRWASSTARAIAHRVNHERDKSTDTLLGFLFPGLLVLTPAIFHPDIGPLGVLALESVLLFILGRKAWTLPDPPRWLGLHWLVWASGSVFLLSTADSPEHVLPALTFFLVTTLFHPILLATLTRDALRKHLQEPWVGSGLARQAYRLVPKEYRHRDSTDDDATNGVGTIVGVLGRGYLTLALLSLDDLERDPIKRLKWCSAAAHAYPNHPAPFARLASLLEAADPHLAAAYASFSTDNAARAPWLRVRQPSAAQT